MSMGEKTSARLHQELTVRLHYAQWLSLPPTVCTRAYSKKWVLPLRGKGQRIQNMATPIFETGFNTPARIV